jgi:hypothetical protein
MLVALLLCVLASSAAAENPIAMRAGFDVQSQWVWRGAALDEISAQPNANFQFGQSGVEFDFWGYFAAQDRDIYKVADRMDFSLRYNKIVDGARPIHYSIGYTQYAFPNAPEGMDGHSEEIQAGLQVENQWGTQLLAYYDFGLFDGTYMQAALNPTWPLDSQGNVNFSLRPAIAFSNMVTDSFGFNDVSITAALEASAGAISFIPMLGYSYGADEVNPDNSEFYGGVGIRYNPWQ